MKNKKSMANALLHARSQKKNGKGRRVRVGERKSN
jgi:hypothetical protein